MSDFEIDIDRLGTTPKPFAFSVPVNWWASRLPDSELAPTPVEEPFSFEIQGSAVGEDLILETDFKGRVAPECSRCGKRYSLTLREASRLVLKPWARGRISGEDRESADPEAIESLNAHGFCLGEDLDSGWYRGPVLRLDELFGEVIALAMPLQPLCSDDCPGVCPHCGVERRREHGDGAAEVSQSMEAGCDCEDEKIESPFAVLAQLKVD